jgi:hypothetical protein
MARRGLAAPAGPGQRHETERNGTNGNEWERMGTIGNVSERFGTIGNAGERLGTVGNVSERFITRLKLTLTPFEYNTYDHNPVCFALPKPGFREKVRFVGLAVQRCSASTTLYSVVKHRLARATLSVLRGCPYNILCVKSQENSRRLGRFFRPVPATARGGQENMTNRAKWRH